MNIIEFKRKTKIQNFSYSPLPDRVVLMGGRVVLSSLDQSTLGPPLPPPPEHLGVLGLGVTVTFWHLETGTTLSGIKGILLLTVQPRLGRHISVESCIYKNQSTESCICKNQSTENCIYKIQSIYKNQSTDNCIYKKSKYWKLHLQKSKYWKLHYRRRRSKFFRICALSFCRKIMH